VNTRRSRPAPPVRTRTAGARRRARAARTALSPRPPRIATASPPTTAGGLSPGPWNGDATALSVVTGILVVFGLVMSFSASFVDAAAAGDAFGVFRRQAAWAGIGAVAFIVVANVAHPWWRRLAWPLLLGTLGALVLVLVPGVGVERFGSTRWLGIGPLAVQPSEIAKLAVLVWLADVYERKRPSGGSVHTADHLLVPAVAVLSVTGLLVLFQPDLGTAVLLALVVGAVLWVEGLPLRYIGGVLAALVVIVAVATRFVPYRMARITGWLAPESDPLGSGFQLLQARYALGSGGVLGIGLGSSRGKWHFVPNPETDFIFAIIGEELGLVGASAVIVLFGALLVLGLRVAFRVPDPFGRTVAFAITAWLVGQALVNIGTVVGLLPITGVTLPLLSVGGSSLIVTMAALGMLVSVSRRRVPDRAARGRGGRA
jgi:cell division protein FtsW